MNRVQTEVVRRVAPRLSGVWSDDWVDADLVQRMMLKMRLGWIGTELELPPVSERMWREVFQSCWMCNSSGGYRCIQLHHIERRSHAPRERHHVPENWFAACERCHDAFLSSMPHAKQLAIKWMHDQSGHTDFAGFLVKWLRIKDPELVAPRRVTEGEVVIYIGQMDG